MKTLVSGSGGFIGKRVCAELIKRDHEPIEFDRSKGDDVLKSWLPHSDGIIHLAGILGTSELFTNPAEAVDINVKGTLRVLDYCRAYQIPYVGITMPEVFPSIYTATKVCATRLATAYHHAYGVGVTHVRAFNAFGPGQKHGHGHPRKIIPAFAVDAWAGRPLTVWGDGEQTVDLIYVDQLAKLLVDALDSSDDIVLDGGSGESFTVNDVAEMVLEITGSKAGIEHLPMRRGENPTQLIAQGEGWERLDWKPHFEIDDLIQTVLSYK